MEGDKEQQEELITILDNLDGAIFILESTSKAIVYFNDQFENLILSYFQNRPSFGSVLDKLSKELLTL